MAYDLEQFCKDANAALTAEPGPEGREKIREKLEELLKNKEFVDATCGPDASVGVHTLYRDADHDFVVLAHINDTPRVSPPHDHGTSWAIYGQATEYTHMREYRRVDGKDGPGDAEIELAKEYRLEPGMAGSYPVGAIHSIDYPAGARFVRVTGTVLEEVDRLKFDMEGGKAEILQSQGVN